MKLPYLNVIVKETLRLYPVSMFAFVRVMERPLQLGARDACGCAACALHLPAAPPVAALPALALSYSPERFLQRQFVPYEYLPFGGGDRRCIGLTVQFEIKLVLATLFEQW